MNIKILVKYNHIIRYEPYKILPRINKRSQEKIKIDHNIRCT